MDLTGFTDADQARLTLSVRLRELSEAFRVAVAAEDGGTAANGKPDLAAQLWSLLSAEVPLLQSAIVHHVRSRGGSWADVAALVALSEDEARERWSVAEPTATADPVGAAAALDQWYLKHAQLEPLAQFRDPFSRLLSMHAPREHECLICVKSQGGTLPTFGGYAPPPGGFIIDDGMWRVGHGPASYWPAGTLLVESCRHFLDYAELNDAEAAAFGPLIRRLVGPLKEATGAPRIHLFSSMEGAEHYHVWLVPRVGEVSSGRSFIANPGYCGVSEAEAAISRLRSAMARAGADR